MVARKKKPKPSQIVIMVAKKKNEPTPTTYSPYDNTKNDSYWNPCIVDVISDCHNNSRAVKGRQQEIFFIVKVLVATGLWKESKKKKNSLWRCLWPRCALKFQITFWASGLPPLNISHIQVQLITFFNATHKSKTGTANIWGTT